MAGSVNVNPNRMELLKLRRRLAIARRGHRLLKDKLDELMKPFLAMVGDLKGVRAEVERELIEAHHVFTVARSEMSPGELEQALAYPSASASVTAGRKPVLSVMVPDLVLSTEGEFDSYGLALTPAMLDEALTRYEEVLPRLIDLAQREKAIMTLAEEIEKTRRRVNALEYVLLPQLEESVRYITMKLDEFERENLTRLMKIKQMVGESL